MISDEETVEEPPASADSTLPHPRAVDGRSWTINGPDWKLNGKPIVGDQNN
jgi:hypothetical protein